jgi:hypothetical protein
MIRAHVEVEKSINIVMELKRSLLDLRQRPLVQ